ncbi:recombinase family protein [Micromonospora sp. DH14]|uniref:recombinase family protein n=1 Tax=Micromonospora sp. DH14 TaxID=3040120 RepID=UPI002442D8F1|nr:recombinase family protein [Micromonospora sp. DH14]MDG9674963.1 recombinase family protein [Micromonospora sp. DH14]
MSGRRKRGRGLGVIRLSKHSNRPDDPSTSPERQKHHILDAADKRGIEIVGWAEDLNVSARKIAPWKRPQLGLWIPNLAQETPTGGRPDEFDCLIFWKIDRVARSVGDFANLVKWAGDSGKNLIAADGTVDLSTPYGKAMAQIVAVFAELEADIIKERVNDGRQALRDEGRWGGGRYPYGFIPRQQDSGGWKLEHHPENADRLREIARRVIAGESMNAIGRDFDKRGIPTPTGGKLWEQVHLTPMLRHRSLIGEATHNGETVRDDLGRIIQACDPLIMRTEWDNLQKRLDDVSIPKNRQPGVSMLLRIGFCGRCGLPLWLRRKTIKGVEYRYSGCSGAWCASQKRTCDALGIRADFLESMIEEMLMNAIGDLEMIEQIDTMGEDRREELAEKSAKLADLLVASAGAPESVKSRLAPDVEALTVRVTELESQPVIEPVRRQVGTGQTYRQLWQSSDDRERRRLLVESGIRVEAIKLDGTNQGVSVALIERPGREDDAIMIKQERDISVTLFIPHNLAQRATGNPAVKLLWRRSPLPVAV